jgi:hypothetical protein
MLRNIHDGFSNPQLFFITGAAYFQIWSDEAFHQVPLHDIKVGIWCAASARQITSPIFFYCAMLLLSPYDGTTHHSHLL